MFKARFRRHSLFFLVFVFAFLPLSIHLESLRLFLREWFSLLRKGESLSRAVQGSMRFLVDSSSQVPSFITIHRVSAASPTCTVTAPASGATVSGASTSVTASATGSGSKKVQFYLDVDPTAAHTDIITVPPATDRDSTGTPGFDENGLLPTANRLGAQDSSSPYGITWNTTGASNGSHTLSCVTSNQYGQMTLGPRITVTVDNDVTPPTITSVSSNMPNTFYTEGDVIDIDVTFSEAVTSTGNVTVTLDTGRTCTFTVSNSATGTCNYTVQVGDESGALNATSIVGTIADQVGNPMSNFVPATNLAENKALEIVGIGGPPTPGSPMLAETTPVPTPSPDTTPTYTFNSTSAGTVTYGGDDGCTSVTTVVIDGDNTVTFSPLPVGTYSRCFIRVTDSLARVSPLFQITSFTIEPDITAPTITSVTSIKTNGSYKAGEVIDIVVNFSEAVTSSGNVTVTLETGATDRTCTFTVSSSATGTCNYTVQAGDTSSDLTVNSIAGTIADQFSNPMSNFVPATNLAASKALVIDTTAPTNQSTVFASNATKMGGVAVTVVSSLDATNNIWFAPSGTVSFSAGATMTTAGGTATSILSPATAGSYKLFVIDAAGNYSSPSTATLTVDTTAPAAPSGLALQSPATSPANDTTPTITVSGVVSFDTVTLHTNDTCTAQMATNTAIDTTINLTSGALTEASYSFYAKSTDPAGNESPCSSATVAYVLDTTAPTNQNSVFTPSATKMGGVAVTVVSSLDATNNIWFAPSGTVSFSAGATMTTAGGTATSILSPATAGSYKLFVIDAAGNYSSPSTATLTVDNTAPVRSAGAPSTALASGTTSTGISLTTDESATCKYAASSGVAYASMTNTFETTGGTSHLTTVNSLSNGNSYTYYVRCQDTATNTNSSDYTISFSVESGPDLTPPTITSVTSVKANGTYKAGEIIDIVVNFSEAVTSTGDVTVTLETGVTDRACTFTVSNSSTGTCNYTVQATDTSSDLTTNSIAGIINDQAPAPNQMVDFTPTTTLATSKALVIDTTAPSVPSGLALQSPATSPANDTTPTITVSGVVSFDTVTLHTNDTCTAQVATGVAGGTTINLTSSVLAEASYSFYAKSTDPVGNPSACSSATVAYVLDTTAPTNQNSVFTPSATKMGGVAVTVVSSLDATNNIWFAPSGTTTFSAGATMTTAGGTATSILSPATAGSYKLFVIDAAGNYSSPSTATLTVDNSAPVVIEFTPVSSYTNDTTPSYTFSTTEGGTIGYGEGGCSSATTTATSGNNTLTFNTLSVGTYSGCTIQVTDIATNQSSLLHITSFTIDITPPDAVSITAPIEGATLTGTTSLTATATDAVSMGGVQFTLDDSNIGSEDSSSPYSLSWNSATASNGTHTLGATARDSAGNTLTATTITVSISNTATTSSSHKSTKKKKKISSKITYKVGEKKAPYITLSTLKVGTLTTKNFSIKASVTDKSGIQAIIVSINGVKKKRANTSSITYSAKKITGTKTITVTAYDTLGNAKVSAITVTGGKVTSIKYY